MKPYSNLKFIIAFLVLCYLFYLAGQRTDTQRPPTNNASPVAAKLGFSATP